MLSFFMDYFFFEQDNSKLLAVFYCIIPAFIILFKFPDELFECSNASSVFGIK